MRINSVDNTNYIKCTDTASILEIFVTDYDGSPVNMSSYSKVEVVIGNEYGRLTTITPTTANTSGYITFKFTANNMLQSGRYFLEVHLTKSDGSGQKKVAPSKGMFVLIVTDSIDEITGNKVNVIDLQALLQMVENSRNNAVAAASYAEAMNALMQNAVPIRVNSSNIEYPLEYLVTSTSQWKQVYGKLPTVLDLGTF